MMVQRSSRSGVSGTRCGSSERALLLAVVLAAAAAQALPDGAGSGLLPDESVLAPSGAEGAAVLQAGVWTKPAASGQTPRSTGNGAGAAPTGSSTALAPGNR